jgi:hypothetical protein
MYTNTATTGGATVNASGTLLNAAAAVEQVLPKRKKKTPWREEDPNEKPTWVVKGNAKLDPSVFERDDNPLFATDTLFAAEGVASQQGTQVPLVDDSEGDNMHCELPAGWLDTVDKMSTKQAVMKLANCPCPPCRHDLNAIAKPTKDALLQIYTEVEKYVVKGWLENVEKDDAIAIACYTVNSPLYKLTNAWSNVKGVTVKDMEYVAPFLRRVIESLQNLPSTLRRSTIGVRAINATLTPSLLKAHGDYTTHFKVNKRVRFDGLSSFGKDSRTVEPFAGNAQGIIFTCDNVEAFDIKNLSMIPTELELLVTPASHYTVKAPPQCWRGLVMVQLEMDHALSGTKSYLRPR